MFDWRRCARIAILACAWLALGALIACARPSTLVTLEGATMGTTWSVKLVAPRRVDVPTLRAGIQAELDRVVAQMSTYESDSDLSRFSRAPAGTWQTLPPEFFEVLSFALELARDTDGAYDPTIGPLVDLWGFGPGPHTHVAPDPGAIASARARVGWQRVALDPLRRRAFQPGGVSLDLSSIAKGFATDQVARYLQRNGVANFLVDISGELRAHGQRADGREWRVGIEKPDAAIAAASAPNEIERSLTLHERSIATSGDYRHFFEADGVIRSHHIDPRTGSPVEHKVASVTTVARDCMHADALGTALIVLGFERGMDYARHRDLAVLMIVREGERFEEHASPAFEALMATR